VVIAQRKFALLSILKSEKSGKGISVKTRGSHAANNDVEATRRFNNFYLVFKNMASYIFEYIGKMSMNTGG
jgi:hypothetical protein